MELRLQSSELVFIPLASFHVNVPDVVCCYSWANHHTVFRSFVRLNCVCEVMSMHGCCAQLFSAVFSNVGVKLHSLNMSPVTSRVSIGVGLWVSLALDQSWRLTQRTPQDGHSTKPVDACASDRHTGRSSGAARQWVGCLSPQDVNARLVLEKFVKREVCVRSRGSARVACSRCPAISGRRRQRHPSCGCGRCRLIEEAMMFHVTPATWPILTNRGPDRCPKKEKVSVEVSVELVTKASS